MNRRPMILYSLVVVVAMLVLSAWAWAQLSPDALVPIHWGIDGQPDGFGSRESLFLMPLLAAGIAALLAVIPRFEPRRANLERSGRAYGATWIGVMTLFAGLQVLIVAAALGATFDMSRLILTGTGVLFIIIGNYLPTVRPNFVMGIRTPWTLSSDLSWVRTHRIGGRLFVIEGVAMVVLGVLGVGPEAFVVAIIAAIVAMLVVVFVYSYRVWKIDPERRQA